MWLNHRKTTSVPVDAASAHEGRLTVAEYVAFNIILGRLRRPSCWRTHLARATCEVETTFLADCRMWRRARRHPSRVPHPAPNLASQPLIHGSVGWAAERHRPTRTTAHRGHDALPFLRMPSRSPAPRSAVATGSHPTSTRVLPRGTPPRRPPTPHHHPHVPPAPHRQPGQPLVRPPLGRPTTAGARLRRTGVCSHSARRRARRKSASGQSAAPPGGGHLSCDASETPRLAGGSPVSYALDPGHRAEGPRARDAPLLGRDVPWRLPTSHAVGACARRRSPIYPWLLMLGRTVGRLRNGCRRAQQDARTSAPRLQWTAWRMASSVGASCRSATSPFSAPCSARGQQGAARLGGEHSLALLRGACVFLSRWWGSRRPLA